MYCLYPIYQDLWLRSVEWYVEWIKKDLEGSSYKVIAVLGHHTCVGTEQNQEDPQLRKKVCRSEFRQGSLKYKSTPSPPRHSVRHKQIVFDVNWFGKNHTFACPAEFRYILLVGPVCRQVEKLAVRSDALCRYLLRQHRKLYSAFTFCENKKRKDSYVLVLVKYPSWYQVICGTYTSVSAF